LDGTSAPATASITVSAPTLSLDPATLPAGAIGAAYSETTTASGGTSPYSYAITAGSLPAGLALSSAGVISGTPTGGGTYNFTLTATDSSTGTGAPFAVAKAYSITIAAPTITVAPTTLAAATLNASYSETITASGGTSTYTYAVTAGALPAGLTLSSAGDLSGTPTAAGTFNFTVTATDSSTGSGPYTGSRAYTLVLVAHPPIANGVTATVAQNSSANPITLNITGGTPLSVAIATAAGHGTATASGTSITYTPTAGYAGADSFTYTATNLDGTSAPATASITVPVPTISLGPTSLPGGSIGAAYSQIVTASDGTSPYSYAITAGALPAGLTLSSGGTLSGTPTAAGTFNVTITATDSSTGTGAPFTASRAYSLTISAPTIGLTPV
ncbi:putative Ig domain-containing protein, partial [Rhizobium rhizogenes]|uniref:putative Ig domain-containing protein n=1 Tax=Rhizobium rhizogenes TaxID=359 RepID=UPI00226F1DF2